MRFPARLVDGYHAFLDTRLPVERERYHRLAETGQQPETMVIGCCDSRVSPEVIFDAHPGELFVVRNIANLVPAYSPTGYTHGVSAALEFAVEILKVKHIIVLGHTHCGGIRAFVEHGNRPNRGDFIDDWMSLIASAAETAGERDVPGRAEYLHRVEQASIVGTLGNLMTFPWIKSLVDQGQLELLGAYFDVATGLLAVHDRDHAAFTPVVERGSLRLS